MKSLKEIWKKAQRWFATSDIFGPSPAVARELMKEGYDFEMVNIPVTPAIGGTAQMIFVTHNGKEIAGDADELREYKAAKQRAADKIYGPS